MRHFIIVGILVIATAALTYFGLTAVGLMPVEASVQSLAIDWLFNYEIIAISFLFALIVVPLFYSLIVFRRRKGETGEGEYFEGNTPLEIGWTVAPLIVVIAFAYMGTYSLGEVRRVDPNAMEIKVTGFQWNWRFEYPEYGVTSNELHLPVNRQVVLKMESIDVLHSFFVPEFRMKQDVVPGRVTEYRVTPSLIGDYKVRCAEMCGTSHAYMGAPVIVSSAQDFDAWIKLQNAPADPVANGQKIIATNGCLGCHTIDGAKLVGPTWKGLYGKQETLADGSTITVDDAYLAESIVNPTAKIVQGYPPVMPPFNLKDQEIADVIAYLATLK
ncbi:MAG: cytochrome c oxidase subunit II [Anaerolineales bacterium]|nr:cytochrome c oxidase subunit II [Anaerolineales bacterium]